MVQYTPINMQVYSWFSKNRLICRFIYGSVNTDYSVGLFIPVYTGYAVDLFRPVYTGYAVGIFRPVYTCYAVEFSGCTPLQFLQFMLQIFIGFILYWLFIQGSVYACYSVEFSGFISQIYSGFCLCRKCCRFIQNSVHTDYSIGLFILPYTCMGKVTLYHLFCKKSNKFEDLQELSSSSTQSIKSGY